MQPFGICHNNFKFHVVYGRKDKNQLSIVNFCKLLFHQYTCLERHLKCMNTYSFIHLPNFVFFIPRGNGTCVSYVSLKEPCCSQMIKLFHLSGGSYFFQGPLVSNLPAHQIILEAKHQLASLKNETDICRSTHLGGQ